MNKKRHKKETNLRKKLENALIADLRPLAAQGTYLSACLESDAQDRKYSIAKKRYSDLLKHAESTIKQIRQIMDEMETATIKEQKKDKLASQDEVRNKAIKGENVPETPKHRRGWF